MNQLSLFRLLIPSFKKRTQVIYPLHHIQEQFYKLSSINNTVKHFTIQQKIHNFNGKIDNQIQDQLQNQLEAIGQNQIIKQQTQIKQQLVARWQNVMPVSLPTFKLKKNFIDERITSMQYQANNPCEDKYSYSQLKSIDAYTISIFDGHGGPQLAQYSKAKINNYIDTYLQQQLKDNRLIHNVGQLIKQSLKWSYKKIEDTFYQIYQQQIKLGNKKIKNVGTCAITAVVHNDKVYIGNSGDSQGIFILREGLDLIRSQKANERLSVNNKNQRDRILKDWKDIDENIIVEESANSYYLKGRLQPTRTIGDYYLKKQEHYFGSDKFKGPYLSCQPNIEQHKITKSHQFMVIASDGVWDVLSKNDVMNYLFRQKQIDLTKTCYNLNDEQQIPYISNVVNNVLQKASEYSGKSVYDLKKMQKGMRRNYHDDITIAVINLENQLGE